MSLTTEQYNEIKRVLDGRRAFAYRDQSRKQEEAEKAIPALSDLNEELMRINREELSARFAKDREAGKKKVSECVKMRRDLLKTKKDLLKEYGFRPDQLEPSFTCRKCGDTGYVENEKCSCFASLEAELINRESGLPGFLPAFGMEKISSAVYDDSAPMPDLPGRKLTQKAYMEKNVIPWMIRYVEEFDRPGSHNLFLTGPSGTGKTYLTGCVAKSLMDRQNTVIYVSAAELFDMYRKAARGDEPDGTASRLEKAENCDLLIIDDLGTEAISDFSVSRLFSLISRRLSTGSSTIISSNCDLNEISRMYGERISSRIMGGYTVIGFFGTDLRLKKARTKGDRT